MIQEPVPSGPRRVQKIVVLGGGSAGFLVALALRKQLPGLAVEVVRSTKMGVIGVGEGTIISVVNFLHNYLRLDTKRFHERAKPSLKLGIRYLWGSRPFFHYTFSQELSRPLRGLSLPRGYYCQDECDYVDITSALMAHNRVCLRRPNGQPQMQRGFAYHLENRTFVQHLEELADEAGIPKIDDVVRDVEQNEHGLTALILESGQRIEADLFVDSSGFRSELLGQALAEPYVDFKEALYCDRALVGGWPRSADDPYYPFTTAETMSAGWCWRIEHDDLVNRGYVFSSAFQSDEEAEREYRALCPLVQKTHIVKFLAGSYRRTWIKNVVAIGNSAGFVEPLEATAIGMICDAAVHLCRALQASDSHVIDIQRDIFNKVVWRNWEIIRDFLAIHYRFNRRLDTPFWRACQNDVQLGTIQDLVDYYQAVGPDFGLLTPELKRDFFSAEGYLAMLVGQQVPYQRTVSIPEPQAKVWREHKLQMKLQARDGMGMNECLGHLRERGLAGYAAAEGTEGAVAPGQSGELVWH